MLIAIDASRATVAQRTGTEGYSLNIIRGLLELGKQHQFHLYFRDHPHPDLFPAADNVTSRVIHKKRLWTHTGLGPAIRREKPDVLFVPAHVIPWPNTGSVPSVVTIHDLGYLHYPGKHALFDRLYLDWSTRHSANTARRVIAHSKATAHDLTALNNIPADKIKTVYSGVDDILQPVKDQVALDAVKKQLGIPGRYVLHVGRIEPRKNLQRLIEAFAQVKKNAPDVSLVLAGKSSPRYLAQLEKQTQALGISKSVLFPGYVPDEILAALYSAALAYTFPSLYEGFGFPVLEAMACGTPVICSNTSSLPELTGNAALLVAPTDTNALAVALRRLIGDAELRHDLVTRGFERVNLFTWSACAKATFDVIIEAAGISGQQLI